MLFTFMPSIPLMYAIGKTGCLMAGCCHGIGYGGWGHIVYCHSPAAPAGVALFPVQLTETIVFSLIFVFMLYKTARSKFDIPVLGISFILSGTGKFTLDFLRMSHTGQFISINQWFSIFFILIGLLMLRKPTLWDICPKGPAI